MVQSVSKKVFLLCGSRLWQNRDVIYDELLQIPIGAVIREGEAPGADKISGELGESMGFKIDRMPAEWKRNGVYNPLAGFERNLKMLTKRPKPIEVIAFWDGASCGTLDTIDRALHMTPPIPVKVRLERINYVLYKPSDAKNILREAKTQKAVERVRKIINGRS